MHIHSCGCWWLSILGNICFFPLLHRVTCLKCYSAVCFPYNIEMRKTANMNKTEFTVSNLVLKMTLTTFIKYFIRKQFLSLEYNKRKTVAQEWKGQNQYKFWTCSTLVVYKRWVSSGNSWIHLSGFQLLLADLQWLGLWRLCSEPSIFLIFLKICLYWMWCWMKHKRTSRNTCPASSLA